MAGRIAAGGLISDDIAFDLVSSRLQQPDVQQAGAVLDGYPRSVEQARRLEAVAHVEVVVNLAMRQEALVAKLLGRCVAPHREGERASSLRQHWPLNAAPAAPSSASARPVTGLASHGPGRRRSRIPRGRPARCRCTCARCGKSYNTASVHLAPDALRMLPPVILMALAPPGGRCEACGCAQMVRRADDTPATIANRLEAHWTLVAAVERHYRELAASPARGAEHGASGTSHFDRPPPRVVDFEITAGIPETLPHLARAVCATGRVTVGAGGHAVLASVGAGGRRGGV